jgi:menaquinone-9 beta-reductase
VGCGWALQTAEWLTDEVAPEIHGGDLDAALERHRRLHRRRLGLHNFLIADLAPARPANAFERAL